MGLVLGFGVFPTICSQLTPCSSYRVKENMGKLMKIGELAKLANCDVETIRYYERVGLLAAPPRTETGYRAYTPEHVESLRFIRQCRALRMGLVEIRTLITLKDDRSAGCQSVNELLDQHVETVDRQLQELHSLRDQLVQLRAQCHTPHLIDDCAILQQLDIATKIESSNVQTQPLRES